MVCLVRGNDALIYVACIDLFAVRLSGNWKLYLTLVFVGLLVRELHLALCANTSRARAYPQSGPFMLSSCDIRGMLIMAVDGTWYERTARHYDIIVCWYINC